MQISIPQGPPGICSCNFSALLETSEFSPIRGPPGSPGIEGKQGFPGMPVSTRVALVRCSELLALAKRKRCFVSKN